MTPRWGLAASEGKLVLGSMHFTGSLRLFPLQVSALADVVLTSRRR